MHKENEIFNAESSAVLQWSPWPRKTCLSTNDVLDELDIDEPMMSGSDEEFDFTDEECSSDEQEEEYNDTTEQGGRSDPISNTDSLNSSAPPTLTLVSSTICSTNTRSSSASSSDPPTGSSSAHRIHMVKENNTSCHHAILPEDWTHFSCP